MRTALLATALLLSSNAHALTAGDIAFTSFNADAEYFAFTSWVDLAPGTTIHFTDKTWSASTQRFSGGEGWLSWTTSNTIRAGTIISIDDDTPATSSGSITSHGGNFNLSGSGESLYAYLGSPTAPGTILAALSSEGSSTLEGLSTGASLLTLPNNIRYSEYTGPRSALPLSEARGLLASPVNWSSNTANGSTLTPDLTAFSISAVPEPTGYAMLLASLCLGSLVVRRRS